MAAILRCVPQAAGRLHLDSERAPFRRESIARSLSSSTCAPRTRREEAARADCASASLYWRGCISQMTPLITAYANSVDADSVNAITTADPATVAAAKIQVN